MEAGAKDPCFQPKRCRSRGTGVDEEDENEQSLSPPCVKRRKRLMIRGRETNTVVILPEDMIHSEILTRLPTKYILRCRLVCKSWYSRFSTPSFVKSHLMRQHHHHPDDEEEDLVIFKPIAGTAIHILSRTTAIHVGSVPYVRDTLLGSINGLIALSCLEGKRFCLWNPVVAQFKYFPMPPPHHHPPSKEDHCIHFVGGFCWDRVQDDDYKVLLFCYHSSTSTPSQQCIYSSNSSTWTQLPIPAPAHSMLPAETVFKKNQFISPPSTIVKGIPYWSYIKYLNLPGYKRRRKFISTFKFLPQINEFRFLPDLDSLKIPRKNTFQIVNIKDHLVGMAYNFDLGKRYSVDIYSLGDHESQSSGVWTKMYTVGPVGNCYGNMRLSQCFKNGGEILIYGLVGPFHVYHPKTNETKVHESSTSCLLKTCFSYMPSLVCVPRMELMQGSFKESPTICNHPQSASVCRGSSLKCGSGMV